MSTIAAPADRRFRRAHVKPTRRRTAWALTRPLVKYGLVAVVAVLGLYRGGAVVAHARVLQIDRIVVRGNERLSSGDVVAVLNGLRGESLMWADLDAWRRRLLSSPWVKDASLRRSFPSTVEVVVSERAPMGIGRLGGALYVVDESGVVVDEYGPQYADLDLPIVDGLAPAPGAPMVTDESRAQLAARVIASLRGTADISKRLSQVDVADVHNAAVVLSGDPAVIYVGDDRFLSRLQSYLELAEKLRERVAQIDYVDLRFDDRIYVRPVPTTGTRRTNGAAAARGLTARTGRARPSRAAAR
jgi:cell division protein FtsQ